jgi:hypothetical protein
MSTQQSDLSSAKYGYDFVVATTQESINATMKEFLDGVSEPEVVMCYVDDGHGNPKSIDYKTLPVDPFSVPANVDLADTRVQSLWNAGFMCAFKARLGLPPGYAPEDVPDVVTLCADTALVTYRLLCSEFTVTQTGGQRHIESWLNQSQEPGQAWIFTSEVKLSLLTAELSEYSKLPPAVRAQIKNLDANAFSVQQLLFDLDNAILDSTRPQISGVVPGSTLDTCLQKYFLGAYFAAIQKTGTPVLGYSIKHSPDSASTLKLTDLNMEVNPYVDKGNAVDKPSKEQSNLVTLNYLCAADGNPLPPAVRFKWNWIDPSEAADYHGAAVINRNTLAKYFEQQLLPLVKANCYKPWVHLVGHLLKVDYEWSLTNNQDPEITRPATGSTVLTFSYSNSDESRAGHDGSAGKMELKPTLNVTVQFSGNTVTIEQHLTLYLYVKFLATSDSGNIIDKTLTDTYTLSVDDHGGLVTKRSSKTEDHSKNPKANGFLNFWADVNSLASDVEKWARAFVATDFTDIPVSAVQSFVFPGGKTFAFKDVSFSNNQDLVSRITYVQPD